MAVFQQDAGDVQFPFVPHNAPPKQGGKARVIGLLGNLGLEAIEGKIKADLVGPEQDPERFTPDEGRTTTHADLVDQALNDKELNLRTVALARSQGLISAAEAKTRANMAVQSATARLPGRAAEFRQKAAAFFGDFGEGQGLLQQTEAERKNANIMQQLMLLALKNGYLPEELPQFLRAQRSFNEHKIRQNNMEAAIRDGKYNNNNALNFGVNVAQEMLTELMGELSGSLAANEGILFDSRLQLQRLQAVKTQGILQLQKAMAQGPQIAPALRDQTLANYKAIFEPVEVLIKSGNLATIMSENAQLLKDFADADAMTLLYGISVLNRAGGPTAVTIGLETQARLDKMPQQQRALHLDINPLDAAFYGVMDQIADIEKGMQGVFDRVLPQRGTWRRAMVNSLARDIAIKGDPEDERANAAAQSKLEEAHADGETVTLDTFADPRAKARQKPAVRKKTLNWVLSNLRGFVGTGPGILASGVDTDMVFEDGKFQIVTGDVTQRVRPGFEFAAEQLQPGSDALALADEMNRNLAVLRNYADTPEYQAAFLVGAGQLQTPEQIMGETLGTIKAKVIALSPRDRTERLTKLIAGFEKLAETTVKGAPATEALKTRLLSQIKDMAGLLLPVADPEAAESLEPGLYTDENGDIFRKTDFGTVVEVLDVGKK